MHRGWLAAVGVALLGGVATGASGQEHADRGNAAAGREYALHNCESCHVVAANQDLRPLIPGYAPSFSEIANRPTTTAESLRVFLSHPHAYGNMPYPDLGARDLADLVAYISSLRGKQ